jgi:hypothetical protein
MASSLPGDHSLVIMSSILKFSPKLSISLNTCSCIYGRNHEDVFFAQNLISEVDEEMCCVTSIILTATLAPGGSHVGLSKK